MNQDSSSSQGPGQNHLAGQSSPYLRQHAHNPVDWYPWGAEALERARTEDRPIFLSIGYSACHWCHVMERESFQNKEIAGFLNDHYVSIKVDREERPDLDDLYMAAVQLITGSGGWPMSVWLTPELKPFYGGTYFPPDDRYGRPGLLGLLRRLLEVYKCRREEVETSATAIADRINSFADLAPGTALLTPAPLQTATAALLRGFDRTYGGFGSAPKFPAFPAIRVLLRQYQRHGDLQVLEAVQLTLDGMAEGGISDHLGGGFHRYSTDQRWLVPHFEKMLYDQALLVPAYLEGFLVTKKPAYATVVRDTLDYVLREMTAPDGGFYSTQDADSEGEEGRFYTWTPSEIRAILGDARGTLFCRAYDVTEVGHLEGRSILHPALSHRELASGTGQTEEEIAADLRRCRNLLRLAREKRVHPLRDEKIITAWNGIMIAALAMAGRVLGEDRYTKAAVTAGDFLEDCMTENGRLLRVYQDGRAHGAGYLEDYAGLVAALVELYETTFDRRHLERAMRWTEMMVAEFGDTEQGGFYNTSARHPDLFARLRNAQDGSTPSGNSLAAHALLRLGRLVGREEIEQIGIKTLRAFQVFLEQAPGAFHHMLLALDLYLGPRQEVVFVGEREHETMKAYLRLVRGRFLPRAVTVWHDGSVSSARVAGAEAKVAIGGQPTAYLCREFTCRAPVTTVEELAAELDLALIPR